MIVPHTSSKSLESFVEIGVKLLFQSSLLSYLLGEILSFRVMGSLFGLSLFLELSSLIFLLVKLRGESGLSDSE